MIRSLKVNIFYSFSMEGRVTKEGYSVYALDNVDNSGQPVTTHLNCVSPQSPSRPDRARLSFLSRNHRPTTNRDRGSVVVSVVSVPASRAE